MMKNRIHYVLLKTPSKKIDTDYLNVNGTTIQKSEVIKYLGYMAGLTA